MGPRSRRKGWRLTMTRAWPAPASHTGRQRPGRTFQSTGEYSSLPPSPTVPHGTASVAEAQTGKVAGLSHKEQTPLVSQNWPPGLGPLWSSTVSRKQGPGSGIILVWPQKKQVKRTLDLTISPHSLKKWRYSEPSKGWPRSRAVGPGHRQGTVEHR